MPPVDQPEPKRPRSFYHYAPAIAAGVIIAAVAAYVGVYGTDGLMRNASTPDCAPAVKLAAALAPLVKGEVAALTMATTPLKIPDLAFSDAEGKPRKLSDWNGRTVLVNLWATWCVPCRKEMPALDGLQGRLGSTNFEVVAINIDTRDSDKPRAFFNDAGLTKLTYFQDPKAKVFQDLKAAGRALGMPTSILVDGKGCEIATIAGPAEWSSEDAAKLVEAALTK